MSLKHGVVMDARTAARRARFERVERRIEVVTNLLDDLIAVPGTRLRFGLDPILGLIPVVGDAVGALVGFWIVLEAAAFGLPRIVLARMVANVLLDMGFGALPIVGDAFDFLSKSNAKNLALFRRHASDPDASTVEHALFFLGIALVSVGLLWLAWNALAALGSIVIPVPHA